MVDLFLALLIGQTANPFTIRAAPPPAFVIRVADTKPFVPMIYDDALAASRKDRKPVIVFVGVSARRIEGCHVAQSATFPDAVKGIVVGVWTGESFFQRFDLPAEATDEDIRRVAAPKRSSAAPLQSRPAAVTVGGGRFSFRSVNC